MKTWQTGVMVAKKDFCEEGENLVNRRLLQFMPHLAAHLLAYHAVAFVHLLSCFRFPALVLLRSCIHGLHLDRNSGAAPYRVIGVVTRHSRLEILFVESPSQQSPAVLAASACCCSRYVLGSLDIYL